MNGGPSIIRRPTAEKSNTELTNSLRANFLASKQAFSPTANGNASGPIATKGLRSSSKSSTHLAGWTSREGATLFIPSLDFSTSGLSEERSQYDITVKLFFLPSTKPSERCSHTQEAISLVLRELHVPSIDLLIVSFQGISFDADDDEDEDVDDDSPEEAEQLDKMVKTWQTLEHFHSKGVVKQIGLAEFGSERLKKFLPRTKVRPSVDQINVRDCCVVPKSLILYAKQEKIELLTHNDCTDILPKGTVRELLGTGENGVHLLSDAADGQDGLKGEVEPQWVVKYTAVVRDRGVIESKGYFAMADISG
jgi:glutamate--cysteine ligase regulatory subunit